MNVIKVNRKDIGDSAFPMCRKLIKEGHDPDSVLEIWGDKEVYDYRITNIGWGAKKMIRQEPSLKIVNYSPPPSVKVGMNGTAKPQD